MRLWVLLLAAVTGAGAGIAAGLPGDALGGLPCTVVLDCTTGTTGTTTTTAPPPAPPDSDGDGVPDTRDNCVSVPNRDQANADGDALGNACDPDADNDGMSNDAEAFLHTSPTDADTDDDGLSDGAEERLGTNPLRRDTDRDGLPDGLEVGIRRPGPGTSRLRFRADLDPRSRTNPLRRDTDGDGLSDGREDRNHDGRRQRTETDPRRRDTDGDAVPDGADRFPLNPRR